MASPKLTMRSIRRHPDVISNPEDLSAGLEVAVCTLMPSISKNERCGQALMALISDSRPEDMSRWAYAKEGYKHTPTWGLIIDHVGTVNWVNAEASVYWGPHASLSVTRTSMDQPFAEKVHDLPKSVDEVRERVTQVPEIQAYDLRGEVLNQFDLRTSLSSLGLGPYADPLGHFVINLS